jgi:hypothetical protein
MPSTALPLIARRQKRAHPAPTILPEHEELADLAHPGAGEVRALAHEREAGEPPAHEDDEVVPAAPAPESPMPAGTAEPAVRLHVPAITGEIVDVQLHEVAHRGALART